MMKKILISLILLFTIFNNKINAISLSSKKYIVYDLINEKIIESSEDLQVQLNSLLDLVVVAVASENLSFEKNFKVSVKAKNVAEEFKSDIYANEEIKMKDLSYLSLYKQSDDSLNVLIENISDTPLNFYTFLNNKLGSLGLEKTMITSSYANSSVFDILKIFTYYLDNHLLTEIFTNNIYVLSETNKNQSRELNNPFKYQNLSGYVDLNANHNLIARYKDDNIDLLFLVLDNQSVESAYNDLDVLYHNAIKEYDYLNLKTEIKDINIDIKEDLILKAKVKFYLKEDDLIYYPTISDKVVYDIDINNRNNFQDIEAIAIVYHADKVIKEVILDKEVQVFDDDNTNIIKKAKGYFDLFSILVLFYFILNLFKKILNYLRDIAF